MYRVCAYIDGHNLINGMIDAKFPLWYRWLDVCSLVRSILAINQEMVIVKYFTALQENKKPKTIRKQTYIEALETLMQCEVIRGKYIEEDCFCPRCNRSYSELKEKMTDVNMALEILKDAHKDRFDIAMLLSGDSDLVPVVEAVKQESRDKRVISVFPPKRTSDDLKAVVDGFFRIGRAKISQSPLPNRIRRDDGTYIVRPVEWAKPSNY